MPHQARQFFLALHTAIIRGLHTPFPTLDRKTYRPRLYRVSRYTISYYSPSRHRSLTRSRAPLTLRDSINMDRTCMLMGRKHTSGHRPRDFSRFVELASFDYVRLERWKFLYRQARSCIWDEAFGMLGIKLDRIEMVVSFFLSHFLLSFWKCSSFLWNIELRRGVNLHRVSRTIDVTMKLLYFGYWNIKITKAIYFLKIIKK